jgi:1,4-alpha-glucan branching enzyme
MYEQFGASEIANTGRAQFQLFLPDSSLDPLQYTRGGDHHIRRMRVAGTFQRIPWDMQSALVMTPAPFAGKGQLYTASTHLPLARGFYEYKYFLEFDTGNELRAVCDPCTKYGGSSHNNSGFVIDQGIPLPVRKLAQRVPLRDSILYELMIDDFTAADRGNRAPMQALVDPHRIQHLLDLGVSAVELMPWTAWPGKEFSWGYTPFAYFSVAHRYTLDPIDPTKKLVYLKQFINTCHDNNIAVIMDGVFDHADDLFGYRNLYQNPDDCPYIGRFMEAIYGRDLDYANMCTNEFVLDVCKYWIDTFKIDGIRFDETSGFYQAGNNKIGLMRLIADLRQHIAADAASADIDPKNFNLTLEHSWDYDSIDVTNKVGADSCWFYPPFWSASGMLQGGIRRDLMRALTASRDFAPGTIPTAFIENHDHSTITASAGGRDRWWRTQPWMIALFTMPAVPLLHNGQEWGQVESFPEPGADTNNQRVQSRPIDWNLRNDAIGKALIEKYRFLIDLRKKHPALRGADFFPADWQSASLNSDGIGVDEFRQLIVYRRTDAYIVALNFSGNDQTLSLAVPKNGTWKDLLSPDQFQITTRADITLPGNWGRILHFQA